MKEIELSTEDFNALVRLHSTSEQYTFYEVSPDGPTFLAKDEVIPPRCFTLDNTRYVETREIE